MNQPAPPAEPSSGSQAAAMPAGTAPGPAEPASRMDAAVQAMAASIERLDALGLEGVEPAAAFHWS